MIRVAAVFALVGMVVASGCSGDGAVGARRSPILDGAPNPGDPAVVYLLVGDGACTGSVIDPYTILTARHCLEGVSPSRVEVFTGANPSWGDGRQIAFAGEIYANEVPDDQGDITILRTEVDLGVDPLPYSRDMRIPHRGDTIVAIGYGQGTDSGDEGPKRRGEGVVQEVGWDGFLTTAVTCYGDSGGPIFDLNGTIVGVVSAGTQDPCSSGQDFDVNVGYYADWLDGFVGQGDPSPDPDPDPQPDPDPIPDPDPDPVPSEGALGDPCSDASECASNACITGDGYCTQSCDAGSCPAGYECRDVGSDAFCIQQGGSSDGRARSGCSSTGGAGGDGVTFVVLGALALVVRRRRGPVA